VGDHVRTHYLRHKPATGAIVGMEGPLIVAVALVDQVTKERAAKEISTSVLTAHVGMEQHASTLKEVISASVNQVSRETSVNKISTSVLIAHVRMEQRASTLTEVISASVNQDLKEISVNKI